MFAWSGRFPAVWEDAGMDMIAVELGYLDVGAIQIGPDARWFRIVQLR